MSSNTLLRASIIKKNKNHLYLTYERMPIRGDMAGGQAGRQAGRQMDGRVDEWGWMDG